MLKVVGSASKTERFGRRSLAFPIVALALVPWVTGCRSDGRDLAARTVEWLQSAGDRGAYAPPGTPAELGIAGYAKVLCSAVFVSGREPDEAARNSGFFMLAEADRDRITEITVDRKGQLVHMTLSDTITRTAKFYGDQGCVIHPQGQDSVFFSPVPVETALPDAMSQDWPMGDRLPGEPLPPEVDQEKLAAAVEAAFADPEALTAAFVVVYKGRIVAERYMPGINKDTQLESWSMGKSLTATLVGILVKEGHFGLYDQAPVPAWHTEPGDPRAEIRIADLLRMSSGLRFIATQDPDYTPDLGYPDHMYIYTGAIDAFEHSYTRPVQFPVNTEGRYRNSDPLTLGYIIRQTVTERGEEYLTFPQRALFDRIGIRKQVLETDPYGNFLLTGYDYGTARNWARLGLLYLWDGVWLGERILPEGWVEFVSSPAPAWDGPRYGGLFWLNRTGQWNLPPDAYFMAGGGGQRTLIVPSLDLVVVRLGHFRGNAPSQRALNEALELLTDAIEAEGGP
jgi:CubicO group peptidase (beta-lactamase class C family)